MSLETILLAMLTLLIGTVIGFFIRNSSAAQEESERKTKGDSITEKAKKDASDIKYRARRDAKDIIKEEREGLEQEMRSKQNELKNQEREISKKELKIEQKKEFLDQELEQANIKKENYSESIKRLEEEKENYKTRQKEISEKLAEVAGMTREEAKQKLISTMEDDAKVDAAKSIRIIEEEAKEEAEKRAKNILSISIQRFAGEYVTDKTISSVELPSDDVKGRLIGREGRNIRAFEQICGVDLIIDDTPEVVVISSFNVVRREIARNTIQKLIADGRIHPAKIEEFHDRSRIELDLNLKEFGEKAQMEIGVHGIHPKILKLIGALSYRTSYIQNQYEHALESAFLCGSMASELGVNVKQARRAGLLHDIGKVLDASAEGAHAVIGAEFAKRYGESADIVHAIRAHHNDEKPESVLAYLVSAADAISGARPGARKSLKESYISRLTDIENIVKSFSGVSKSYAISAGREVRVLVENDKINDEQTISLSRDIAKKIEEEMTYPGTIKVTVLRETRATGIAR